MGLLRQLRDLHRAGVRAQLDAIASRQAAPPSPPPWLVALSAGAVGAAVGAVAFVAFRPAPTRKRHDRKVVEVAKQFRRAGYDVFADVRGWPQPPPMNGSRADVVAHRGRELRVVEVEHPHTLDTSHTRRQLENLSDYCADVTRYTRQRCELDVVLADRR